jgi:hypothetical protein
MAARYMVPKGGSLLEVQGKVIPALLATFTLSGVCLWANK